MAAVGPSKTPLVAINNGDRQRARKGWMRTSLLFRVGNMFKAAGEEAESRWNSMDDDSKAAAQRRKERTEARKVLREQRAVERSEREARRKPLQVVYSPIVVDTQPFTPLRNLSYPTHRSPHVTSPTIRSPFASLVSSDLSNLAHLAD